MQHVTFEDDGIDMAIRHGKGDWPHLHVTQLCTEILFPVCSPTVRIDTLDDLAHQVLLHDRDPSSWVGWLRRCAGPFEGLGRDPGAGF